MGKSSLINALLQSKGLARASKTPGRTAMANLFLVEDCLRFVDLPGYGYAKVSKSDRIAWQSLVDAYLRRPSVKHVLFLLDARRLFAEGDGALFDTLAERLPVTLALTKIDKLSQRELVFQEKLLCERLEELAYSPASVHWVSQQIEKSLVPLRQRILHFNHE